MTGAMRWCQAWRCRHWHHRAQWRTADDSIPAATASGTARCRAARIQYDAGSVSGTTLSGGTEVVFASDTSASILNGGRPGRSGGWHRELRHGARAAVSSTMPAPRPTPCCCPAAPRWCLVVLPARRSATVPPRTWWRATRRERHHGVERRHPVRRRFGEQHDALRLVPKWCSPSDTSARKHSQRRRPERSGGWHRERRHGVERRASSTDAGSRNRHPAVGRQPAGVR